MVSKNQRKLIKSLYQKKYRKQHGLFVAEGKKVIKELLDANIELHSLFTVDVRFFETSGNNTYKVTDEELKQISFLTTPQTALGVFYIPKIKKIENNGLVLALDDVRDPGNLGTIIRLCDWFGVKDLVCSLQTVDCYNTKVIQATMGSITRVNIQYVDLVKYLEENTGLVTVFGTFMDGDSVYAKQLPKKGIVVMGNEANGISRTIEDLVDKRLTIPQFGQNRETESLNVATATAILLSEFRRS
ncbi:TrmH family RNA methyltransferase [Aquimarina pacifica]|uniref:TrmH family RNA methyltransferase n=1 Tax=Aquimarina pacifica TaxID=1296415 RepID=UPI00046F86CF|nr:RNA methyltransferase [Aquimarina pacifica]